MKKDVAPKPNLCPWCGKRLPASIVVCHAHADVEVALRRHHRLS